MHVATTSTSVHVRHAATSPDRALMLAVRRCYPSVGPFFSSVRMLLLSSNDIVVPQSSVLCLVSRHISTARCVEWDVRSWGVLLKRREVLLRLLAELWPLLRHELRATKPW